MDKETNVCIFCPAALDKKTKQEHIILNCLGGRKKTKKVICSKCNESFGSTIDKAVADDTVHIRNMLNIQSGTRKSPKTITGVKLNSGRKINIKPGFIPESQNIEFKLEETGGNFSFEFKAGSAYQLEGLLKQAATNAAISYNELIDKIGAEKLTITTSPITQSIERHNGFGGEDFSRSLTKSCLILWALAVGNTEVSSDQFSQIRAFIKDGELDVKSISSTADCCYSFSSKIKELGFSNFSNLVYVSSDANGKVIGLFSLFNMYTWKVCLAESGGAANCTTWLISDPMTRLNWKHALPEDIQDSFIPYDWLNNFENNDSVEQTRAQLINIYGYYKQQATERVFEEISKDAFNDVLGKQYAEGEEEIRKVTEYIHQRFFCFITDAPYTRNITIRQFLLEEGCFL